MARAWLGRWSSNACLAILGATALAIGACDSEVTGGGGGAAGAAGQGATAGAGAAAGSTPSGGTSAGGGGTGGGVAGAGGGGSVQCNPSSVTCYAPTPICPVGQVPAVDGDCWGPCVPILSCATEASCDTCLTGFCAQYTAWTTEYRCVLPSLQCSALACSCLAPYFCVAPFDSCQDATSGDHDVTCSCPTC